MTGTATPTLISESHLATPIEAEALPVPEAQNTPRRVPDKRRQQNRHNQTAFRQRSKMTLKTLKDDLNASISANEALYDTMEELLKKTDILKRSIEDVLASRFKRSWGESATLHSSSGRIGLGYDVAGG